MSRLMLAHGFNAHELLKLTEVSSEQGFTVSHINDVDDLLYELRRLPDAVAVISETADLCARLASKVRRQGSDNFLLCLVTDCSAERTELGPAMRLGADDAQPFRDDFTEFGLRLPMILRRGKEYLDYRAIPLPNAVYDASSRVLRGERGVVHFTPTEDEVLQLLARRQGMTITKDLILDHAFYNRDVEVKIVDVMICKVRKKLREVCGPTQIIETVWGRGYRFAAPVSSNPAAQRQAA